MDKGFAGPWLLNRTFGVCVWLLHMGGNVEKRGLDVGTKVRESRIP